MNIHDGPPTPDGLHGAGQNETQKKKTKALDPAAEIVRGHHLPLVIGLSQATIWRLRHAGQFVPEISLGTNAIGFKRSDISAWIEARSAK